ncbi:MAG: hypothetical protein R2767_00595 [Chitinophagales bacterium]|nr:hypothetical protein [Chitinophagales bacterium]HPE98470.1 hypothetical protein [Chitinophagales bacterium]HPR28612.1 hypothetical protein [Chitinophagales bacterium]HQU39489.1 hypothetical protein [Chitinophagales bacterium]HQU76553.1 hypothetical protein [Chitinophagales bacterium]
MKIRNLLLGFTLFALTTAFSDQYGRDVYICKGPQSTKYHYISDCRGLSNCSSDIYRVSLDEAKSMGRTLCGWED